jgi:hypothetical protein
VTRTDPTGRSSRWGRILFSLFWIGAIVVLVVVVVRSRPAEEAVELQSGFTSVQRQSLSSTESFSGTVRYDTPVEVTHVADGEASGNAAGSGAGGGGQSGASAQIVDERITWVIEPGAEVDNGDLLYEVNHEPVVLLTGSVPSYRTLQRSDTGDDVAVLQAALVRLGYDPDGLVEIDGQFGALTEDMVEAWQQAIGAEVDGAVDLGEIVVRSGASRVASVAVGTGDEVSSDTTILVLSSVDRVIELDVEADRVHLLADGRGVDVRLPDRTLVAGRVVSIDSVVDAGTGTVRVIVESNGIVAASDQAPVTVLVTSDLAMDALVVETEAIMSTLTDGYVLEVIEDDGSTVTLPIEVGVTDGTVVVVSGAGLEVGLRVRAPI